MNNIKTETFCRLCVNTIDEENYSAIDDATREILNFVLLKVELDDKVRHLICSNCSEKLYAAFNFKSSCCYTDNVISAYANLRDFTTVDLKEVYLSEKEKELSVILSDDQKVCRLCLELTYDGFKPISEVQEDIFNMYMPEINFMVTNYPIICETCNNSLEIHSSFIKQCLNKMNEIGTKKEQTNTAWTHPYIKTEEIEIKSEECDCDVIDVMPQDSKEIQYKDCSKYDFESRLESYVILKDHVLDHNLSENNKLYKCDVCDYQSKYKYHLSDHLLVHKNHSEIHWYKCAECDYRTKVKGSLKGHMLQHKDPSEIQWYKCEACDYKSKTKCNMKTHMLQHKDPSEIKWYKCGTCDFISKYKSNFNKHNLGHKDSSEVQWYECSDCDYKAKVKRLLKSHMLQHKNSTEIQWYRCNECDYKAKVKQLLKAHMLQHKDPSEIQWYKCDACDYKTKNVYLLKSHKLVHINNPFENPLVRRA